MVIPKSLLFAIFTWVGAQSHNDTSCRNVHYQVEHLTQKNTYYQNGTNCGQSASYRDIQSELAALQAKVKALEEQATVQTSQKSTNVTDILTNIVSELAKLKIQQEAMAEVIIAPRDCDDVMNRGKTTGYYRIDIDGYIGSPNFKVLCNMTSDPVSTIFEHNYPVKTEVVSAANHPNGKIYNIQYAGITSSQFATFVLGKTCKQFLRYDCYGSHMGGAQNAYWFDRHGNKMSYWPGGPPSGRGCACGVTKTCAGGASNLCECDKNDHVWRFDEGYITDTSKLPVSKLYFSDTDSANEMGHFTLGPLICY